MSQVLTRGHREAKDIIEAAEEQGWRVHLPGSRGQSHLRMIPPNGGVPVGISATPSDVHFRRQIIRLMRRSDPKFVWPWPPKGASQNEKKNAMIEVPSVGQWKPILGLETFFELSPFGEVRKRASGRRLVAVDGKVKLFDPVKRMVYEKDVAALVSTHYGHPIKTAEPTEPDNTNQENTDMSIQAEALGLPVGHVNGDAPEAMPVPGYPQLEVTSNGGLRPSDMWREVHLPQIADGYKVSRLGEVRTPKDKICEPAIAGLSLWVSLRRSDIEGWQTRSTRVDKLVLLAFVGEALDNKNLPVHKDGDPLNCALNNLEWGTRADQKRINEAIAAAKAQQPEATGPILESGADDGAVPLEPVGIEEAQEAGIDWYTAPEPPPPVVPIEARDRKERLALHRNFPDSIPIDDLDLTVRTYNLLNRNGIINTGSIASHSSSDFFAMRNFSQRCVDEVRQVLAEVGLSLKPDPIPAGTITDFQGTTADGRGGFVDYADGLARFLAEEEAPVGGSDEVEELRVLRNDGVTVTFDSPAPPDTDIKVSARTAVALAKILRKLGAV
jgi:hypothetical protein